MNETNYGNFAEPKEEKHSKRSEEVLISTLEILERIEQQLEEANEIIKEYAETETQDWIDSRSIAKKYLEKWGLK